MILEMFFRPKAASGQKNYHNILIGIFWISKKNRASSSRGFVEGSLVFLDPGFP